MDSRTYTYQTRIDTNADGSLLLNRTALLFGHVERSLFADYNRGKSILELKSEYLRKHKITARQFNAIRIVLEGKIASIQALQKERLEETITRIQQIKKAIKFLTKLKNKTEKQRQSLHQKKRKLTRLERTQSALKARQAQKRVSLCFGSKKLFNKQYHLEENGYSNFSEWKADWQSARCSQFYVLGSKDETMGNQSCVASVNPDGTLNLRLRVPDALIDEHGKYVEFTNLRFKYGHDAILKAITDNLRRSALSKQAEKAKNGDLYKHYGQAINYRFLRDDKGWRVFVTIQRTIKSKTLPYNGAIGVDINVNHLAVTEINGAGNYIHCFNIPLNTYGKSQDQSKALIGNAVKHLVDYAATKQKPIVIEDLDFTKKKRTLSSECPKYARQLSSFSYASIIEMLKSRAYRFEVSVFQVNPAYTSVIGRVKFARIYNQLSVHQAAAMVIARRFFGFSERLPRCLESIPNNKGRHVTLQGLVKISVGHVWRTWANVRKILHEVLAAVCHRSTIKHGV